MCFKLVFRTSKKYRTVTINSLPSPAVVTPVEITESCKLQPPKTLPHRTWHGHEAIDTNCQSYYKMLLIFTATVLFLQFYVSHTHW